MGVDLGSAYGKVALDFSGVKRGVEEAQGALRGFQGVADKMGGALKKSMEVVAISAAAGFAALAAGITLSVKSAIDAEEADAKLAAVLTATKGAAGVTADEAKRLATALQGVTRYEDETVMSAESVLLRFREINKNVFPQATELSLDLATALGIDASSAALMLGKALETPGEGLLRLKMAGVALSDEEIKLIQHMADTGNMAGAQKMIMDELTKSVGGSAKVAAQTFGGQMDILKNQFGDVMEVVGGAFLPMLRETAQWINQNVIPAFRVWAEAAGPKIQAALKQLAEWMQANVLPVLQKLAQWIQANVIPAFQKLADWAVRNLIPALQQLAQWIMSDLVPAIQTYILPLLAQFAQWLGNNLPTVMQTLGDVWNNVLKPVLTALSDILGALLIQAPAIADGLGGAWTAISSAISGVWSVIGPILQSIFTELAKFWTDVQPKLEAAWNNISRIVQAAMQDIWDFLQPIVTAIQQFLTDHGAQIQAMFQDVWNVIGGIFQVAWAMISGTVKLALDLLSGDFSAAGQDWNAMAEGVMSGLQNIFSATWDIIKNIVVIALTEMGNVVGGKLAEMRDAGRNILQGLIDGFNEKKDDVLRALSDIINGAINSIKRTLHIASPSQVFAGIGEQMAAGLALGFAQPQLNFAPVIEAAGATGARSFSSGAASSSSGSSVTISGGINFYGTSAPTNAQEANDSARLFVDALRARGISV
jgi:phage-related protein